MSGKLNVFLPYGRHTVTEADIEAVNRVLRGDWLTTGPEVDRFEEDLADAVGAQFAVACSSGTAALHLAALALGLGPGQLAVVPAMTFSATANAVRYAGSDVVFADTDPDCGLMRETDLMEALEHVDQRRSRAVFPVHLAGQCWRPDELYKIAKANDLFVVEDASHAIGTRYRTADGQTFKVGGCAHADLSVFSFHPVKTIAMGEGGAILTNDAALSARLKELRSHGVARHADAFVNRTMAFAGDGQPNPWYYELQSLGFNYRASDILCALARSQLSRLDQNVARRRDLVDRYAELLAPLAPIVTPIRKLPDCDAAWHLAVVLIDFTRAGVDRATVMGRMKNEGIGTQVHYIPVPRQPYYERLYGLIDCPGAMAYYERTLSLPLFPDMTDGDVERVVQTLTRVLAS